MGSQGSACFSPKVGALGSNSLERSSRMKPTPWPATGTSVKRWKSGAGFWPERSATAFMSQRFQVAPGA